MAPDISRPHWYWLTFAGGTGGRLPPGEELAALRSGLGREPGTVPRMWPFHRTRIDDERLRAYGARWRPPVEFAAEHHALALFGLHQQSQRALVHRDGVSVGTAVRQVKRSGKFSEEAVDRRFAAAATATSLTEVVMHMRGIIQQMRSLSQHCPLDYSQLCEDLAAWAYPQRRQRVRRLWGARYFAWSADGTDDPDGGD